MDKYDIIICSGGKCGSSTLLKTFIENGYETLHTHGTLHTHETLKNKNIDSIDKLLSIQEKKYIYIFDSYRTPIERHISAFFQNVNLYILKPLDKVNIYMLIYWYNKLYIDCDNYHPLDSITPIFNDYKFDFDKEYIKKSIHLENKEIIYIKLRFKSIHLWDIILSEILEKPIIIYSENISDNKSYANVYKEFKNNYLVPIEYFKKIQTYDTFIRYNSLLEKEEYIKEWTSKSMETDLFLEKITDDIFTNIPKNFNCQMYIKKNSLEYNDLDAKIHYELIGFYQNLEY